MLNGLDLFSGIGGLTLALEPWVRPVAYCENDRYAQGVLLSRMADGSLPVAPIWDDVRTLHWFQVPDIDIIYGGFPCQDISVAGAGAGLEGSRSGLFFDIIRLARDIRPSLIFLENVTAITIRGLDRVLLELVALGYDCRWTVVSAGEVGADFEGERWFLLAAAFGKGQPPRRGAIRSAAQVPKSTERLPEKIWTDHASHMARVSDGLPTKSHRIGALGNAVVPLQAREAFCRLAGVTMNQDCRRRSAP